MARIEIICTECGAHLSIEHENARCPYCGTAVEIDHSTYYELTIRDNLSEDGECFLAEHDLRSAANVYHRLMRDYPYDYRGWWGQVRVLTDSFTDLDIPREKLESAYAYLQQAKMKTAENGDALQAVFSKYEKKLNKHSDVQLQYVESAEELQRRKEIAQKSKAISDKMSKLKRLPEILTGTIVAVGTLICAGIMVLEVSRGKLTIQRAIIYGLVVLCVIYFLCFLIYGLVRSIAKKRYRELKAKRDTLIKQSSK